jgi:hypothetical protein
MDHLPRAGGYQNVKVIPRELPHIAARLALSRQPRLPYPSADERRSPLTFLDIVSALGFVGWTSEAIMVAVGINSRRSSSRFGPTFT